MNIGLILAGGSGSRMGATQLPKQFLKLGSKPIIIHTIEQFMMNENIAHTVVSVNEDWISFTEDIIQKYIPQAENVSVIKGGKERSETVLFGSQFIVDKFEDAVIVSHDAVRPFITQKIIDDNINEIRNTDAKVIDTIIPSADTIVEVSETNKVLKSIPERKFMYLGQTPQTFYGQEYIDLYNQLDEEKLSAITDVCKMYVDEGYEVGYVLGSEFNMKITTQFDFKLADVLIKGSI